MKKKKDNRGGKRIGAGRPATGDAKQTIALYVKESIIINRGGKDNIKKDIYSFLGQ